jgi:hypothetical protein
MARKKYTQGEHPNSLANLTYHKGRQSDFGERKKTRGVSLTDEGWNRMKLLAELYGCSSVSDFLEKVARGLVEIKA